MRFAGWIGLEPVGDADHRGDRVDRVGVDPEPEHHVDRRAEARRLVGVRPRGREPEHVREELDRGARLRAAAGDPKLPDRHLAALDRALGALPERVGEPLEDRAVDVGTAVDVAEAEERALRLRPRIADAGHPVRLQDEAHRARR